VLEVSPREVWKAARTPIVATLLMSGTVVATEVALPRVVRAGDLFTLAVCLFIAGAVYLGTLVLLDRRILLEARGVLLKGF
jgi:hypothetical protein